MSDEMFVAAVGDGWADVEAATVLSEPGWAVGVSGRRAALVRERGHLLAFVGRLDNAAELASSMGLGKQSTGTLDAAPVAARLLLAGWLRWGPRIIDRAEGGFAGAVLDVDSRVLSVFRDLTAGQSAFVARTPHGVIAGDDAAALATWGGRPATPSLLFAASYLQNLWIEPTNTAFENVTSVMPGHVASAEVNHSWRQRRYADWHVRRVRHPSMEAYLAEFTELFDTAVSRRLEGVSRASVALSGGLDSTNVLASAVRVAPSVEWTAYAIPFFAARGDERQRQQDVAAHCGVPIRWIDVKRHGPLGLWSGELMNGRPYPPWAGNWFFGETICEQAQADGVAVVYDGEDADSLLTGNRTYFADMLVRGQFVSWLREARRVRDHEGTTLGRMLRYSLYKQIPPGLLAFLGRRAEVARPSPLVAPGLASSTNLDERLAGLPLLRIWHPGRRFREHVKLAGNPLHLGTLVPELAMAARSRPVVTAHPFFDRSLMTYCMGLPWHVVCGDFSPKRLLRELARRRLPPSLHGALVKAQLDEYYDDAVFDHERARVLEGLALASDRTDWCEPGEVTKLRDQVLEGTASFLPSRVAMLMLWERQLRAGATLLHVPAAGG
jgi:asparagine synthase (glutamine-hydrolysing)